MDRTHQAALAAIGALAIAGALTCAATAAGDIAPTRTVLGAGCTLANTKAGGVAPATGPDVATDPATGRKFFLDFPCDLKRNEKVVFILNLHGAGSSGGWQHGYFPVVDYVNKYRLVVATPTAATSPSRAPGAPGARQWVAEADDAHLQSVTDAVIAAFGKQNIKAFWLAGHSQGGITSNRLVCTPYFAGKVDGFLSLSGGRIGGSHMNPRFGPPKADGSPPDPRPAGTGLAAAAPLPACDFSHIYETGEHEITDLQPTSPWADKYGCKPRAKQADIVDTEPGYVYDNARAGYPVWGMKARPGTAVEYLYAGCRDHRVVADFERLDKGHTEGLEPKVTEAIVKLMVSAPGGKIAAS